MNRGKEKLLVFGTGKIYQEYSAQIQKEYDIVCFADNDISKQGQYFEGKRVYAVNEIADLHFDKILICTIKYYDEIKAQLLKAGISEQKIIGLYNSIKADISDKIQLSDRKKILLLSFGLDLSGAQIAIFHVSVMLKRMRWCPVVVSFCDGPLKEQYEANGIQIYIINRFYLFDSFSDDTLKIFDAYWINTVRYARFVNGFVKTGKRTIWWIHEPSNFYTDEVGRKLSIHIPIEHDNLRIVTVSNKADDAFYSYDDLHGYRDSTEKLMPLIPDYINGNINTEYNSDEPINIISIGDINWNKGWDIFFDSIAALPEQYRKKIHVDVVGYGYDDDKIVECINENNLFFVQMYDRQTRESIKELFENADICVVSSHDETLSMVAEEALMNGLLLLCSDGAGISDYLQDNVNALIYCNNSSEELISRIIYSIDHFEDMKQIRESGRKFYENFFSENKYRHQIGKLVG